MTKLIHAANRSGASHWFKDVLALASIGAFIWVASTWIEIAHAAMQA